VHSSLLTLAEHVVADPDCVLHHVLQKVDESGKVAKPLELVLQPRVMLERSRHAAALLQGRHFFLDATGRVTDKGFNMFTLFIMDESGAGMQAAVAVLAKKDTATIQRFLEAVFAVNPEFDPLSIMIDMDEAEAGAIRLHPSSCSPTPLASISESVGAGTTSPPSCWRYCPRWARRSALPCKRCCTVRATLAPPRSSSRGAM
jgi:hypothetical protein